MFSFLRNNLLPKRNLYIFKYLSLVTLPSIHPTTQRPFSESRIINTCGLTEDKSISTTKPTHFESSSNPNLVIAFFRNNGFSDTQISKITGSLPELLRYSVDKTLKPKFEFFKSQGITGSELAKVLFKAPDVLKASLEKKIIPCFDFMKTIVPTDAKFLTMLKRSTLVLMQDPHKNLVPNMTLLREEGVSADNIGKFLAAHPRILLTPTSRFREIVKEVKKMKFDPSQYLYLEAVLGLTQMTRSSLEAKFDLYRNWGLSEEEVQSMFRKAPRCMMISEKNIMSTMNYFVSEIGYNPSSIAKRPNALMYSLKKRIIPRFSVIQVLQKQGLVGVEHSPDRLLNMSEDDFLKKYVIKFEEEIPEVLTAYQGKGKWMV